MKRITAVIIVFVMLFVAPSAYAKTPLERANDIVNGTIDETSEPEGQEAEQFKALSASTKTIVSAEEFVYYFNFYGAFMNDGHELSIDTVNAFESVGDGILYKTIFNDCEILTLRLSADAIDVKEIDCTWAINVRGADRYREDYLQLLMETLLACGIEADSVTTMFTEFGELNAFNVGDTGEKTVDGFKVSYEVTSYSGISFKIVGE